MTRVEDMTIFERKEYESGNYLIPDSKHFQRVDPNTDDPHSIQYAGKYRVYLLMKRRDTGEWELPTTNMRTDQSLLDCKDTIISDNFVKGVEVHYLTRKPWIHANYDTPIEKDEAATRSK
eukprot:CAMPEP_0115043530 /NCGR_PEP_ID=MMETSP0216-20121206/46922_1 /TAXON_ID=223996 /ORGANISM="Protocruzia adherens, Strain Boccale" /LENGTH=119 /DNA_ID=CAMNT_0002425865 /DNA_START=17 /DNA_END=376 /DNA_ORIENTATION=+